MTVYVVYVLGDYAQAVALSTDKEKAKNYKKKLRERGITSTWIETIKVSDDYVTELDCD